MLIVDQQVHVRPHSAANRRVIGERVGVGCTTCEPGCRYTSRSTFGKPIRWLVQKNTSPTVLDPDFSSTIALTRIPDRLCETISTAPVVTVRVIKHTLHVPGEALSWTSRCANLESARSDLYGPTGQIGCYRRIIPKHSQQSSGSAGLRSCHRASIEALTRSMSPPRR
jgi:hypothetical protein